MCAFGCFPGSARSAGAVLLLPAVSATLGLTTTSARAAAVPAVTGPADLTAPTSARIVTPVTTQATTASTRLAVAWAATDAGSGIASYDVRLRMAAWNASFGSYASWKNATTALSSTYVTNTGRTVCFSVRARDKAANVSSWSPDKCATTPLDDRSLAAASFTHVTQNSAYGRTLSTTTTKSATLTRTLVLAAHSPSSRKPARAAARLPSAGTARRSRTSRLREQPRTACCPSRPSRKQPRHPADSWSRRAANG